MWRIMARISCFFFQYTELRTKKAPRTYEAFIDKLCESDRLVQDDEKLLTILRKEKKWIEGAGKYASPENVDSHRSGIERQVSF